MTALNRNPEFTNNLQPTKFVLTFTRTGSVQYFAQTVNLPGVSLGEVIRTTPFLDMYSPGTKLAYNPLNVTFLVDDKLQAWKDMYDWFISIASPDGFESRDHSRELATNKHLSDATLTVLNGLNNPVMRVQFTNCFPTSLSDLEFDTTLSADSVVTATAGFRYEYYKYLPL